LKKPGFSPFWVRRNDHIPPGNRKKKKATIAIISVIKNVQIIEVAIGLQTRFLWEKS
jgi:hypothetical protein